jgi:hypothetical protein
MAAVRVIVGRRRRVPYEELQSVVFDARQWSKRDVHAWLQQHGFDPRDLIKSQGVYRYPVRDKSAFVPRSLRTISLGRWEQVTMASNPKGKKKRRAKRSRKRLKQQHRRATRRAKTKRRSAPRRARSKAKTTRTTTKTVKVMRTNARRGRPRKAPGAPRARGATRFTIAFTPASVRLFARVARLSKPRLREMRRALRRHPTGGVYVALPTWHGSRDQAQQLARRVQVLLAYAAGRRRSSINAASAPRVVAVP